MELSVEFKKAGLSPVKRVAERLKRVMESEIPVILDDGKIVFLRTVAKLPDLFTKDEWKEIKDNHFIHELGNVSNICPDYETVISKGLETKRIETVQRLEKCKLEGNESGQDFLEAILITIDAVECLTEKYRIEAERMGEAEIAEVLARIPKYGASSFYEALQFFRIIHFTLWCEGEYHNTVGRFDQYMYPYLKADMNTGKLDADAAFELLEEFFITFNIDSDLYPGVQQGDNGQSLVLGGLDCDGNDAFNLLSEMCLKASKELKLIDPKINLRVHRNTKKEVYRLGTELTRIGLGFPQYSNDEVVISGLTNYGYALEDAQNYSIAACWEFIIPGYGMDIPNIGALSFPGVVDACLHKKLASCSNFNEFLSVVKEGIKKESDRIISGIRNLWIIPAPFMSILMKDCINNASDISEGAKYNNFGLHGTGLATAVDSLASVKKLVYEEKSINADELLIAIDADFLGYDELLAYMRYEAPKFGNNDEMTDAIAI